MGRTPHLSRHRRWNGRHLPVRWAAVVLAAVTVAGIVGTTVARAESARARWATTQPVVVVDHPVAAAELVGEVTTEEWPVALIPEDSFRSVDDVPTDAAAAVALSPGTPLNARVLDGPVGTERVMVAVPRGDVTLRLAPGDRVEVWATWAESAAPGSVPRPTTVAVTTEAAVVSVQERSVVIAIGRADIAAVVEASSLATVTLVSVRR